MAYERFVIVYDADGGVWGELRYVVDKLRGSARCAACDITHGFAREKLAWARARQAVGRPVVQLHRNELEPAMLEATRGRFPCVLGQVGARFELVAEPGDLARLHGSPVGLAALLRRRAVS
jgi:hypothetical protein